MKAFHVVLTEAYGALDSLKGALLGILNGTIVLQKKDASVLRDLVIRRIHTLLAFEALILTDADVAIEVLIDLYVGTGVDPDTKFGGFGFELSVMLDDLHEKCGNESLHRLISHARFDKQKLLDSRVVSAFCDALDCDANQLHLWLGQ